MSRFLDDMAVFAAVVRDGSFTSAARGLGITKQSVSERIARLEERLGVQLLLRSTRALRLTDAGERYHEACASIVATAEEADREAKGAQQHASGTVRVTAPVGLSACLLMPAVRELRRLHPNVRVELVLDERVVDLVRDRVDLAVRAGSAQSTPTFITRPLFETPTAIVASAELVAVHGGMPDPRALERLPCIARRATDTWTVEGHKLAIVSQLVVNTFEAARDAVLAGLGVGQVPLPIVLEDVRAGTVELLFGPTGKIPFTALWPARRLPMRVRAFLDVLSRHARELTTTVDAVLAAATSRRAPSAIGKRPARRR